MAQAFIPVVVHLMSYAIGLAEMDGTIALILGMISTGCVIAALGELKFSMFGFVCQVLAVVVSPLSRRIRSPLSFVLNEVTLLRRRQVESARLVAVQLLIGNRKTSPLVLVYLVAPVSSPTYDLPSRSPIVPHPHLVRISLTRPVPCSP